LATDELPYLGKGGQFAGSHQGSDFFPLSQPAVTNVLFADSSVQRFTPALSPAVFEAMATIAGND
jgi:hypothetical protein